MVQTIKGGTQHQLTGDDPLGNGFAHDHRPRASGSLIAKGRCGLGWGQTPISRPVANTDPGTWIDAPSHEVSGGAKREGSAAAPAQ
jgi:hypothetical protein